MSKKSVYAISAISLLLFCHACDDRKADWYGKDSYPVPKAVGEALRERYPNAQYIEWEPEDAYYVASFRSDGFEVDAWFDNSAVWRMSTTEISYKLLPQGIQATIEGDGYSANSVEDICKVERPYFCTQYYIELSQTKMECLSSGKKIRNNNNIAEPRPSAVPDMVMEALGIAYTDTRVITASMEDGVWDIWFYDTNDMPANASVTTEGTLLKALPSGRKK